MIIVNKVKYLCVMIYRQIVSYILIVDFCKMKLYDDIIRIYCGIIIDIM